MTFSTHSHITGFTKGVFQLACPFRHIDTSQGSPKACFSWCDLLDTFTHHRVHRRRVPVGVTFSTQSHITGLTKGVFQLACPFRHIDTSQGLPKACSFLRIHTPRPQGSPKACFSWRDLLDTFTHHRAHQRRVPASVSFSTHRHITGFAKGVFLSPHPHSTTTGCPKGVRVPAGVSFSTHPHITGFTEVSTESYFYFQASTLKHPIFVAQVC